MKCNSYKKTIDSSGCNGCEDYYLCYDINDLTDLCGYDWIDDSNEDFSGCDHEDCECVIGEDTSEEEDFNIGLSRPNPVMEVLKAYYPSIAEELKFREITPVILEGIELCPSCFTFVSLKYEDGICEACGQRFKREVSKLDPEIQIYYEVKYQNPVKGGRGNRVIDYLPEIREAIYDSKEELLEDLCYMADERVRLLEVNQVTKERIRVGAKD